MAKSKKSKTAKKTTTRRKTAKREPRVVAEPRALDPRLPEVGTVIQKKDRAGNVRCECTVAADGIDYNGAKFRTLSGAAKAAATDLGVNGKSFNGFIFWGLVKPTPKGVDQVAALGKAWDRYIARAESFADATDEQKAKGVEVLDVHAKILVDLRARL